jgi:hypothetical protein
MSKRDVRREHGAVCTKTREAIVVARAAMAVLAGRRTASRRVEADAGPWRGSAALTRAIDR